ncbi:MAG: hypothetical protein WC109_01695 [Syntrophomonadaceae bacterium]
MGQWKLGYPSALRNASSEATGRAAYAAWTTNAITLSSVQPARLASAAVSGGAGSLTISASMTSSAWVGGWCKFRSGTYEGQAYRIKANTANTLTLEAFKGTTPNFSGSNSSTFVEICTGPATYSFPTGRNPVKEDVSISTEADMIRYPYYLGGIYLPKTIVEDIVLKVLLTSRSEFEKLAMLCKWKPDYTGGDSLVSHMAGAPMILECGTHEADYQYLVYCTECKKIREGKGGGLIDVQLYLQQVAIPNYRGW